VQQDFFTSLSQLLTFSQSSFSFSVFTVSDFTTVSVFVTSFVFGGSSGKTELNDGTAKTAKNVKTVKNKNSFFIILIYKVYN
jgi:hypothetical protein